jgi:hypothetical protein
MNHFTTFWLVSIHYFAANQITVYKKKWISLQNKMMKEDELVVV